MPFLTEHHDDVPVGPGVRHLGSNARLLLVFLLVSTALHATVLVALPGFLPQDLERTPVRVFEAVLVQSEPLPQAVEKPVVPIPPQRRAPERAVKAPLPPQPPLRAETPGPVLTLPEPRAQAEPSFTVPAPGPAETRPAPTQARTEVTSVAVTPPSFGASYLRNPAPAYPIGAKREGVQGTVTLRVLVTREGTPARVELEKTSGSFQLDQAALETVKTWRFVPARRGAEPVEDTVILPIVFRLESAARR